jgi:dihydroorotate dehydrogenase
MDRVDMGSNIGKNVQLIDTVVRAVKEVAKKPVWVKLTPTTTNIAKEAEAAFKAGRRTRSRRRTPSRRCRRSTPSRSSSSATSRARSPTAASAGPAILPLSLAKMAQMTTAFPDRSFSGIGGISDFSQALNYFLLGCGTAQVCTAAMLDHAIGPNVIKGLLSGCRRFSTSTPTRAGTRSTTSAACAAIASSRTRHQAAGCEGVSRRARGAGRIRVV